MREMPGSAGASDVEQSHTLRTKNVFVDTSVHVAAKFVYSASSFRRLADLGEADLACVYHTEIDAGEIRSNIGESAEKAAKSLAGFQREAQGLKAASPAPLAALFESLTADRIADLIAAEYSKFQSRSRSREIPLAGVDTATIFRRYFARTAPFEEKKKSEFPDAFIISVLSDWCWSTAETMYVVSRDQGFRDAARAIGRGRLFPLETLDEFLDLVVSEQDQARAIAVQQWLRRNESTVTEAVSAAFLNSGFYLEDADGSPEDIEIEEIHGSYPLLVELRDTEAVFSIAGEVVFSAVLVYDDPDSGIYDKEDDVMLYVETVRRRVRRTAEYEAEITVEFGPCDDEIETLSPELHGEIADIILNHNRDFAVSIEDELLEVLPGDESDPPEWYIDWLASDADTHNPEEPVDQFPTF